MYIEASEGIKVGTNTLLTAFADDTDTSDDVSYTLTSNPGNYFAIDNTTGVVLESFCLRL